MREITLTSGAAAIVDDDDYERLACFAWEPHESHGNTYARRAIRTGARRKYVSMHREIMPVEPSVDHVNGDGLDNRKDNLRAATHQEQSRNKRKTLKGTSSKYKGVYWHKKRECWVSHIGVNYKRQWLGDFESEVDAAVAYDIACRQLFDDFAALNFSKNIEIAIPTPIVRRIGTSKYRGVYRRTPTRWLATIYDAKVGRSVHLGSFENEEEAALTYDVAASRVFGERARLNFPL